MCLYSCICCCCSCCCSWWCRSAGRIRRCRTRCGCRSKYFTRCSCSCCCCCSCWCYRQSCHRWWRPPGTHLSAVGWFAAASESNAHGPRIHFGVDFGHLSVVALLFVLGFSLPFSLSLSLRFFLSFFLFHTLYSSLLLQFVCAFQFLNELFQYFEALRGSASPLPGMVAPSCFYRN